MSISGKPHTDASPERNDSKSLSVDELYTTVPNLQASAQKKEIKIEPQLLPTARVMTQLIPELASYGVILIGILGLSGWILDVESLRSVAEGLAPMKPNTGLGIFACGVALNILRQGGPGEKYPVVFYLGIVAASLAAFIGLATLVQFIFNVDLGIDRLIAPALTNSVPLAFDGRMSIATAFCISLSGIGLLSLRRNIGTIRIAEPIGGLVMLIALVTLMGYAYDIGSLYSVNAFRSVALHTATAFLIASFGLLFADHSHRLPYFYNTEGPSGVLVRRLLPAVIIIPLLFGWLRLKGQQMGFYSTEFGVALFAVSNIVVFAALIWSVARSIQSMEGELDIRDRRLARSREHLELALEAAEIGAWDYEIKTKKTVRTLRHDEIFGYKTMRPSWTLNDLIKHVHPDDRERLPSVNQKIREEGGFMEEFRIITVDGRERKIWARGRRMPTQDGSPRVVGVIADITERRNAEAEQKQIFERITDAFVAVDTQDRYVYVNQNAEKMLHKSEADLMGQRIWDVFPEAIGSPFHESLELARRTHEPAVVEEFFAPLGLWIESRIFASDKGISIYFHDVTTRRQGEENLKRMNELLEHRVEERTRELTAVNRELEAFSYSVSHDLRAPLRAIDGFSAAVIEDHAEALDEEAIGYLSRVRKASKNMGDLIDDLLKLSRVSRAEMKRDSIDMSLLAERLLERHREVEPQRNVEVEVEQGLTAFGDEVLVRALLDNLFSNAWKFTSKTDAAKIEFGQTVRDAQPAFYVRDNGAGFDMTYADKLFGAFQRLHSPSDFEGTGIGLATVQRIVNRHGGTVSAEGEPGKGATFYFSLN